MLGVVFIIMIFSQVECDLKLSTNKITMAVGEITTFQTDTGAPDRKNYEIFKFVPLNKDVIQVISNGFLECSNNTKADNFTYNIKLEGLKAGISEISIVAASSQSASTRAENEFLLVKVYKSIIIEWISGIVGWLYFFAWSISFYPQMHTNYKSKSVVGLNFDFLFFNIVGYVMYNTFNIGLYFVSEVKEQYTLKHPRSLNPVQPNDIFFSSHGIVATSVTISQCFLYESANQKLSITAKIIVGVYFLTATVYTTLASLGTVLWLDLLYVCSYIKICVTVTKYVPQIYMNHKRKSTRGWSISAVLLDTTGGLLSILQMALDGYNYDDWTIIVENPTKFALGIFTIGFDLIFAVQHYLLYTSDINEKSIEMKSRTILIGEK